MSYVWALQGAAAQGVIWSIMALGVYITFRVLDFPDMTCDGSFALGGCTSAILMVALGMNPFLTLIVALIAGGVAGLVTGLLHTKCKIPNILAGILTMSALYSVDLRIMGGSSNTSLIGMNTLFAIIKNILPESLKSVKNYSNWVVLIVGILFVIAVVMFIYWFFGTETGCALRATGNNEDMVRALGENTDKMKIVGLVLGNALIALSGALVAQSQGYGDVGMGSGTIVMGLASIVIGEVVMSRAKTFKFRLISIVVGSVIYRAIIALVLQLGLNTGDLKLLTAIVVAVALSIPNFKKVVIKKKPEEVEKSC